MLNLLPQIEKTFLVKDKRKHLLTVLCFEFFVFLLCIFLILMAIEFYILGEKAYESFLLLQAEERGNSPEFSFFKGVMQDYNQKLDSIDAFYKRQDSASDALSVIFSVERPGGLYFTQVSLKPDDASRRMNVSIGGKSDTREHLIVFRDGIESDSHIENVSFSPESWISQKNIDFNLNFDLIYEAAD